MDSTMLYEAAHHNRKSCIRVLLRYDPHLLDAVNKFNDTPPNAKQKNSDTRPFSIIYLILPLIVIFLYWLMSVMTLNSHGWRVF